MSIAGEIEKLRALLDSKVLTPEEFSLAKRFLLNGGTTPPDGADERAGTAKKAQSPVSAPPLVAAPATPRVRRLRARLAHLEHTLSKGPTVGLNKDGTVVSPVGARWLISRGDTRLDYAGISGLQQIDLMHLSPFDIYPLYYLEVYSDVRQAYGVGNIEGALDHYLTYGIKEGRSPNPFFDPNFYREYYGDLSTMSGESALYHWMTYGFKEGRRGSWCFDIGYYLSHGDLLSTFGAGNYDGAFWHWCRWGNAEGRKTSADSGLRICYYLGTEEHVAANPGSLHAMAGFVQPGQAGGTFEPVSATGLRSAGGKIFAGAQVLQAVEWGISQAIEARHRAKMKALQAEIDKKAKEVERERFREMDRRNYEAERYESTRGTAIA